MKKHRGPRGSIVAVFLLGILIFAGALFLWNTGVQIFEPVDPPASARTISIQIQPGETTAQVADDLQARGLIHSALAFRIWARIKGLGAQLQAGGYSHLKTSMSISDLINQFLVGTPDVLYVTIPEGYRIEQIGGVFAGQGLANFKKKDFLTYTKHPNQFPDAAKYPVLKLIPHGDSMEGLLFPATYNIPLDADARYIVNRMLTAFDDYVQKSGLVAMARANNMNEYQMVILASLVQREINNTRDAPGVAGVYWNRARNVVPNDTAGYLGSDPSVEYARDSLHPASRYWLPLQDSGKNVASGSPWNTYVNQGLPPTPICSPGLATLKAAAAPTRSGNFYFLSTNTGSIVYAKTYTDFQKLEQKYLHS
jgi:UPF0755 protein